MAKYWDPMFVVVGTAAVAAALSVRWSEPGTSARDDLNSVAWMQLSAERAITCEQTFYLATQALDRQLRLSEGASKPPAVVIDVDETVLDNSPYNARLLQDGSQFDIGSWNAWIEDRRAVAIPGARGFLEYVGSRGVTIFYVSNRESSVEQATRDNLEAAGCPITAGLDSVLLRNEYDDDGSDKRARFDHVDKTYNVLMKLGDDLSDFVPEARRMSLDERNATAQQHAREWGIRWFMFPNPAYGGWLRALGEAPIDWLDSRR